MEPNVVFCITCKGRKPHIIQTLAQNLKDNLVAKFVLLNYNSGDGLVDHVLRNHQADINTGRLVMYSNFEPQKFHMAHAKNQAHRLGIREGADVLVNLDADNFTGPGFARWLQDRFLDIGERFMWANMVKGKLDRGITGRIAVTRNAFLMVGGYDEKYHEWSPDDEDFKCRLRMLSIPNGEIDPQFLKAVRHPDKLRFREYPHVEADCYEPKVPICPASAIANAGRVGCGKVFRNESGKPIWLAPIPTRVFGIGMHKTGTSSLHAAFKILGFNSAHWNTANWARDVCHEMYSHGRSETLEQYYAFSDLPFTILYRELDKGYPGSKFILTIRPEDCWIRSIRDHWDGDINPNRKYWDVAPFTHKVHQMLYGHKNFDAEIMLARYRRHNSEVLEYFKDRPEDLLVIEVDKEVSWHPLCSFLDRPVPRVPFPHKLKTKAYAALNYEI